MIPSQLAFRCDGDDRIGAGHVARCLQLARAFAAGGADVVFTGSFGGTARALLEAAGFPTRTAPEARSGELARSAVIVDSYSIAHADIEQMSRERPTAVICDAAHAPRATAALSYHLEPIETEPGTVAVMGVDYAPVSPEFLAGRRSRGFGRALVSMGGGNAGRAAIGAAVQALREIGGLEIFVAAADPVPAGLAGPDLAQGAVRGLGERAAWADVAVAAGGTTAYDLACAGIPAVLVALADNQRPIVRTLGRAGVALPLSGEPAAPAFHASVSWLTDADLRARLASAGPALVDGYGAFRARDAIAAAFSGRALPPILRYRPATREDADLLLRWRNEPSVREWSRSTAEIDSADHLRWLGRAVAGPGRQTLFVVERGGSPAGTVRFARAGDCAEISVTIDPSTRGAGVGKRAVREASELMLATFPDLRAVTAEIHEANASSLRAFGRAGFSRIAPRPEAAGWESFVIDRPMLRATAGRSLEGPR